MLLFPIAVAVFVVDDLEEVAEEAAQAALLRRALLADRDLSAPPEGGCSEPVERNEYVPEVCLHLCTCKIDVMDIQLRSEVTGISHVSTLQEALDRSAADGTIWKISFPIETGERVRLVRDKSGAFFLQPLLGEVVKLL
jgi:hypothetical protein